MLRRIKKNFKNLTMCKKCYAFYYKRDWHFDAPESIRSEDAGEISVRLTECPACNEMEVAITERDETHAPYELPFGAYTTYAEI